MYTRAKEIGRKVMAGGENNMQKSAAARCGQVYGHLHVWPPVSRILTQNKIHSSKSKIQVSSNDRFGLNMDKSPA